MSLFSSLSIASSGLTAIQSQIDVVSQNVSNANTAGYTQEAVADIAVGAGDDLSGVKSGIITRVTSTTLQTSLYAQNSAVASATTLSNAWSGVVGALGETSADTGSTGSLTEALSGLQTAFTTLDSDTTNPTDEAAVVTAAQSAANGFNSLAGTLTSARQTAENSIGSEVDAANTALASIGSTSAQIVQLQAQGQSTASLEDQRDAAMTTLSNLMDVKYTETSNGNMLVSTPNGIILPTDPSKGTLSTTTQNLSASSSYPSTISGIMINGVDVTSSITGGTLGGNIQLRDTDIPTAQAELDSLASTTAQRFSAQGLNLFADGNGAVVGTSTTQTAPNGIVGYAASMQVNPSILSNASLVSSGTGTPSAGGAYSVGNVLTYAFGEDSSSNVAQAAAPSTGLGPTGTLSSDYAGTGSLFDLAASLSSAWGQHASSASTEQTNSTATQTSVSTALGDVSSVSVDTEMSKMVALENSYSANAKIITAVQTMFTAILAAVEPVMADISFSGLSNYGLVGQLGYASQQISQTSATLTQQASDGLISDNVASLGESTGVVLNLQPQLAQLSAYSSNGAIASTRLSVASESLTQLSSIAQTAVTNLLSLRGESGSDAQTTLAGIVSSAKSALSEVGTLLNTQAGGSYVFGGGDGSTAPVADPTDMTSNTLNSSTASAISDLDTNGAAATLQTILNAAAGTTTGATPFTGGLSASSQEVAVGTGTQVATSIPITNATATASSTSTGSSVRDLVAVLTAMSNLSTSDLSSSNMGSLLSGLSSVASNAQSGLIQQEAQVGASQDVVTNTLALGSSTSTLITEQIGNLTSVDAAKVSTELSESNDQLQASYMLISDLKSLNLAAYL